MFTEEVGRPVRLGAGSFSTVYVISGGRTTFKEVAHTNNAEKLRQGYDTLKEVYLRCSADSLFAIPQALACFNYSRRIFLSPRPIHYLLIGPIRSLPLA